MMLRSRNVNSSNINNNAANNKLENNKRGAKKHLEDGSTNSLEPKAKRQALCDLSQGIKNFAIDSAKKILDKDLKRASKRSDPDSLPTIKENVAPEEEIEVDPCPQVDFDKEVASDIHAVSQFAVDIFKYYKSRERNFAVKDYMDRQQITKYNRAALVNWMVELQEEFQWNHETLYLAIKLVDIYLSRKSATADQLQLIACGAMLIASKFEELPPPQPLDDFMYMAEDAFQKEQLINIEMDILRVVGYDLGAPLSYSYLRRYSRVMHGDMETLTLSRYILETIQMFYEFVTISDSKLAAATFFLALKMKKMQSGIEVEGPIWSDVLYKYSGYKEEELTPLVNKINHAMYLRTTGVYTKLQTVYSKYSHKVFYYSTAVPLIPDVLNNTPALQ